MARTYISIGSNLHGPVAQVRRAIDRLRAFGEVLAVSSLYSSTPWGNVKDQPDFVNCVVLLDSHYSPHELLIRLKMAERELGRVGLVRWGPRSIDFDILTYGDTIVHDPDLMIPHPRMQERAFVLIPLAELDANYEAMRDALPANELASVQLIET